MSYSSTASELSGTLVSGAPTHGGLVLTSTSTSTATWAIPNFNATAPLWTKYTLSYTAFAGGSSTSAISLFTAAAGTIIHGVIIKPQTSFSGGAVTGVTLSVGNSPIISPNYAKYASAYDVFTTNTPSSSTAQVSVVIGTEDMSSAYLVAAQLITTGDLISGLTQGSADVWVLTSVPA